MNLTRAVPRVGVFAGWWLLVALPWVGLAGQGIAGSGIGVATDLLRATLATIVVLPLLLPGSRERTAVARHWIKDLRIHMMPLLVGVGVPGALSLVRWGGVAPESLWDWMIGTALAGAVIAGAVTFGEEIEHRTLSGLLCEARSRRTIYLEKLASLACVLLWIASNLLLLWRGPTAAGAKTFAESAAIVVGSVALIFSSAPLFTLWTRSTLAGVVFTVAVPLLGAALGAVAAGIFEWIAAVPVRSSWMRLAVPVVLTLYAAGTAGLAWRCFARLEVHDSTGGGPGSVGRHPLSIPVDRFLTRVLPRTRVTELLRKEMRLHVVPWLVAAIFSALWASGMLLRVLGVASDWMPQLPHFLGMLAVIFGSLTLVAAGAACVAEERQLGTLAWQLTQPVSVSQQWWLKVAVAWLHVVVLGVMLPMGLLVAGYGVEAYFPEGASGVGAAVSAFALGVFLIFTCAVHASSWCRSTMQAAAATALMVLAIPVIVYPVMVFEAGRLETLAGELMQARPVIPSWTPGVQGAWLAMIAGTVLMVMALAAALLGYGRRNFGTASAGRTELLRQSRNLIFGLLGATLLLSEVAVRLMGLQYRAHEAQRATHQEARERTALRELVEWHLDHGGVNPAFLREMGLKEDSEIAQLLLDGFDRADNREAWIQILFAEAVGEASGRRGHQGAMNPMISIQYGIPMKRAIEQFGHRSKMHGEPSSTAAPAPYSMDPELRRRYGLPLK